MSELSEQELAAIRIEHEELFPHEDEAVSRRMAIRAVGRLLAHIDALEAEHAALMTRAMKDADRLGNACIEFTNQQTARIEALEVERESLIESADNLIDEQTARIEALEKTIRKVIYGVRGIDLPCEKWVTAELSHILPGFDQIGGSDSSNQKANEREG